jgi:hypothetical protein
MAFRFISRSIVAYRLVVVTLAWPSHWLIASQDRRFKVLALARNFGHQTHRRGPNANPKDLTAGLEIWEPLGITVLRLEYRAKKADWGQPGFSRMLLRKSST